MVSCSKLFVSLGLFSQEVQSSVENGVIKTGFLSIFSSIFYMERESRGHCILIIFNYSSVL